MTNGQRRVGSPPRRHAGPVPLKLSLDMCTIENCPPDQGRHSATVETAVIKTTKPGLNGTVRVTFALPADEPRGAVSVVGDFNDWNPFAHPLRRRANGTRSAAVTVPAGTTLRFRYLADGGIWFDDEAAPMRDGQDASIAV
jgi:1,4-alpha-glucan branching enzyme